MKQRGVVKRLLAVLALSALAACGYSRICPRVTQDAGRPGPKAGRDVALVKFLGVSGFLIEYQGQVVMTAPLYSNPTLGEVAVQTIQTDHRLVDALLPRERNTLAILAGHSHYDHLLDVPYVALEHATRAVLYGNDDMLRLLAPLPELQGRMRSLEPLAREQVEPLRCQANCAGSSAYQAVGDRIRLWPIVSEHSAQFRLPLLHLPPVHLWRGTLLQPRATLPATASEWVEGTTLSYLIDFLSADGQEVALRVFYQDSGSRKPYGFPPECLLKDRKVDLAILTVGGSETIAGHPHPAEIVTALQPSFVFASHWEDFFTPRELPLPAGACAEADRCCEEIRGVPLQSPKSFLKRLRASLLTDEQYVLPCPDAWARFSRPEGGDGWKLEQSSERWQSGTLRARR